MSAGEPLEGLGEMDLDQLRRAWRERVGGDPPKLRSRELLALAIAYRVQVRIHGDLPGRLKRRAAEFARRFDADPGYTPAPGPTLKPGSSLMREWRGVRHEVRVLEDGFSYGGERFGSLSEVAQRITGTKWNGYLFFRLKERVR